LDAKLEDVEKREARSPDTIANNFAQYGSVGLKQYGGYIFEDFLVDLRMPQNLKVYKEMSSNDSTIGAVLFIFESMMKKIRWEAEPAGPKRVDKQMAEFVQQCMDDMEHSWLDFIVEAISMFIYGWSWHEIVYKKRTEENSKYPDGRVGWAKLPIRSQSTWLRWIYDLDDPDKLLGMEQLSPNINKPVIIPLEKSLLFRTKMYRNSPEGISLLRTAYRSWIYKKGFEELEGIGAERDLAGLPVMTTPEGVNIWDKDNPEAVTLKALLEKLVSNIRRDKGEGVLKPFGYTLELLSASSQKQFDTNTIIGRYDHRMAMSMLADILLMGFGSKGGSFALADTKKQLLAAALEAQADNIANIINTVAIPKLIKLNTFSGYTDLPQVVRGEIETPDMSKLSDAMTKLGALGMTFFPDQSLEEYLRACLGFPDVTDIPKQKTVEQNQNLQTGSNGQNQAQQTNQGTNAEVKGLPPRKTDVHQTDAKAPYNAKYEAAGMKKWLRKIFNRGSE
jgi:hypothetical protein